MGIVVDEAKARETPCRCFQIGPTKEAHDLLCFSKGVIGTLTNAQDTAYCTKRNIEPPSPALKRRITEFTEAAQAASARYKGEGITRWLELVGEELDKRGIEL